MIPGHGLSHAVLLLAHTANLSPPASLEVWVRRAKEFGTFLTAAVDLAAVAERLVRYRLAVVDGHVNVNPRLLACTQGEYVHAPREIATILLVADPPMWLHTAIADGVVMREYIPSDHLQTLSWLEPDLDQVILEAHLQLRAQSDPQRQKEIGDAAEQVIMAGLRLSGHAPIHVAAISDRFGYDIEVPGPETKRIEVKAASTRTRGHFHLSRNEFDASRAFGREWTLIQVVFRSGAFIDRHLAAAHVEGLYELKSHALEAIIQPDTTQFRWESSAMITAVSDDLWRPSQVSVDPALRLPGIGTATEPK